MPVRRSVSADGSPGTRRRPVPCGHVGTTRKDGVDLLDISGVKGFKHRNQVPRSQIVGDAERTETPGRNSR